MERQEFLRHLEVVAPGLADNDIVPVMQCFWFTGDRVMAFNDAIGVSTACRVDFTGAIPGMTLLQLLKASKAKEISFELKGEQLGVKAASSRFNLAYFGPDQFCFTMPKPQTEAILPVKDVPTFLDALEACMMSVSSDTSVPDYRGVTIISKDKQLRMFATNNETMTHAVVPLTKEAPFDRVILPREFCDQLLVMAKGSKKLVLEIFDDHALFVSGSTMLFGRLILSDRPLDYDRILREALQTMGKNKPIQIPDKLAGILNRALVITQAKSEAVKTDVSVTDGKMKFVSRVDGIGEVVDQMQTTQPNVQVRIDPKMLKAGLDRFDSMLITDACAVMQKDGTTYLVTATVGG